MPDGADSRAQYEAVPESLKNVLLVMHASGFLVPPHNGARTAEQEALWRATFDRITPFLPDIERELFPPPKVPVPFAEANGRIPSRSTTPDAA